MARPSNLLTATKVKSLKDPGRYTDGNGLYLRIETNGSKYWLFRYTAPDGKRKDMGLGSAGTDGVSLENARRKAQNYRELLEKGIDPSTHRKEAKAPKVEIPTFGKFADDFVKAIKPEFDNDKHYAQWVMTLGDKYCKSLRKLRIDQVDSRDVLAVLEPIWMSKSETASRIRGRIERVLDAAKAKGFRQGDNPAIWRGGLKAALPRQSKLTRGHHKALPYPDLPGFFSGLHERRALAADALEFLILAAARSGEVREATWQEIDLKAEVWTVPATRMKAKREHRVPLTPRMVEILTIAAERKPKPHDLVFPGQKPGKPMSDMTLAKLVGRMGYDGVTVHGFRSAFRDWVGEATEFQREIAEAALAHTVGDATERAYRRGDALEKRRKLMESWEAFCLGDAAEEGHATKEEAPRDLA